MVMFKFPLSPIFPRGKLIALVFWFMVGQVQSQIMEIPKNSTTNSRDQDIFLKTEIIPEILYVQAQFVYIMRVYSHKAIKCGRFFEPNNEPLDCDHASELNIKQANIQKLGEIRNFTDQYQGRTYKIREQRYAIFPEISGHLEIPSITFRGHICDGTCNSILNPPEKIEQHFPARQLNIQPKPSQFPDNVWWLPAQNFTLNEAWSLNSPNFIVGESITLTLTMQAKGLISAQLPKLLPQNLEGINFYPASPQFKNRFEENWLISQKQQQINLVLKKPGNYTLPEIKIPWWDTIKQQRRYAILPARLIHVSTEKYFPIDLSRVNLWFWISISLGMVWIITLIAWWRRRKPSSVAMMQTDSTQLQNIRMARKAVKQACEQNNPQLVKQALLKWATIRWDKIPIHNLAHIASQLDDTKACAELRKLDRVLYAPQEVVWKGKAFWQVMSKYKDKTSLTGKVKNSPLPELYPEN